MTVVGHERREKRKRINLPRMTFECILGIFLQLGLILACTFDSDCSRRERCCDRSEGRGYLGYGFCLADNCHGFCIDKEDCLPPAICDIFLKRCSLHCFSDSDCHQSNFCKNNVCVLEDEDSIGTTPIIVFVFVGVMCCLCCCCACVRGHLRRSQVMRNNCSAVRTTVETTARRNEQQPVNVVAVEANSPGEQANGQLTPDAIALTGPPSYLDVRGIPELPPPSYEEAMKASTENLSQGAEPRRI